MRVRLKRVEDQVIVITGGTSGIGLTTARLAAARGAWLVITSRNHEDLEDAVAEIERRGGRALPVVADVTVPSQVEEVARLAVRTYGRIDTWVNNAGVSFFGRLMEAPYEDMRRAFEVNFWGTVYGSRAAVPHLRRHGGALINIGSVLSDRAVPLQGAYSASKHAVKGFTDALRVELEEEGAPVSVTLIKPSPPGPVYHPEVVAEAILAAAERPVRELTIGAPGRLLALAGAAVPRLTDLYMKRAMFRAQQTRRPARPRSDNLYAPLPIEGKERGTFGGRVRRSSLYTGAFLHPARALLAAGVGLAAIVGIRAFRRAG